MADLQKQFLDFHDAIKLEENDEKTELRDKREKVLKTLKSGLEKVFEDRDEDVPEWTNFNQGSYAMDTGVKPIDDDYDIDVGIRFHVNHEDYEDPVEVKKWAFEAVEKHTHDVRMKEPCVTVNYAAGYHVDLAIYSTAEENSDGVDRLARGKNGSQNQYRVWQKSDPRGFIDLVRETYSGDELRQFKRVIRYLKRWKDIRFPSKGNSAPVGIGLTVLALCLFTPISPDGKRSTSYGEQLALKNFVDRMLNSFTYKYNYEYSEWLYNIEARMPVEPYDDVFTRMSPKQQDKFKQKLEKLKTALISSYDDADPVSAGKTLRKQFGEDFPIPEAQEGAFKTSRYTIIGSSSSA